MNYKISVLIFLKTEDGRFLLMKRKKSPNQGLWSPIGGKLMMEEGESPFECAKRETKEETGFDYNNDELHLFGMVTEKNYENSGHWLLFLFHGLQPIPYLPADIKEGSFGLFSREEINSISISKIDLEVLWPTYDTHHKSFTSMNLSYYDSIKYSNEIEFILK